MFVGDARAEDAGRTFCLVYKALELFPVEFCIGVEQQDPLACRRFEAAIDAVCETTVLRLWQHARFGKRSLGRGDAVIAALIVHDDDFGREARGIEQLPEHLEQQIPRVPVDDDDRQGGGGAHRQRMMQRSRGGIYAMAPTLCVAGGSSSQIAA